MKLRKFAMRYGIMLIPSTFILRYLKKKAKQKVIIRTIEEILNIIYKYKGDV